MVRVLRQQRTCSKGRLASAIAPSFAPTATANSCCPVSRRPLQSHGDSYIINDSWSALTDWISDKLSEGRFITSLSYGDGYYVAWATTGWPAGTAQGVFWGSKNDAGAFAQQISNYIDDHDCYVTSLAIDSVDFIGGLHAVTTVRRRNPCSQILACRCAGVCHTRSDGPAWSWAVRTGQDVMYDWMTEQGQSGMSLKALTASGSVFIGFAVGSDQSDKWYSRSDVGSLFDKVSVGEKLSSFD